MKAWERAWMDQGRPKPGENFNEDQWANYFRKGWDAAIEAATARSQDVVMPNGLTYGQVDVSTLAALKSDAEPEGE